jgi:multimeric flavodoxin WrbA
MNYAGKKKSVIVINGSVRDSGNTDALLSKFHEAAGEFTESIVQFDLRKLQIGDCRGCCDCRDNAECSQADDMTSIREDVNDARLIIFASPIYWCEVTGLMKTFIDRLYFYHHPSTANLIAGKKVIVVCPMGEAENIEYEAEIMIEFYRRVFKSLDMELLDMMLFPGLMGPRDNYKKPKYLDSMKQLGKQLKSLL